MPRQNIADLKAAIESAPEVSPEHREQILALVDSLAEEIETVEGERSEHLKSALAAAGEAVRHRSEAGETEGDQDLSERVAEIEEKAELLALEHPVVANVLNAISRLI